MKNEHLAPLRKERDDLYEKLSKEASPAGISAMNLAMKGEMALFRSTYREVYDDDEEDEEYEDWVTFEHGTFYLVCLKIKELEAKLYDEAMKGRKA